MRIRSLRPLPIAAVLLLTATSCGAQEEGPDPAAVAEAAWADALARLELLLAETLRRADEAAATVDDVLGPYPLMTPAEENALRRHLNDAHVARGRQLGVTAGGRDAVESLLGEGRLVQLEDSTRYWIVRERTSPAYVVPHTRALLVELGERFQQRLSRLGLPAYRLEVTSALRTAERQAALQRTNPNAAAGVSSHEFGTTVDVSYAAFAPPADPPEGLLDGVPPELAPYLARIAAVTLESASARKSRELSNVLGQVLREAQSEGLVLVILERQQTVYHLTVGRALAEP